MKHLNKLNWAFLLLMVLSLAYSCKKDDATEVIASFTYLPDAANFKKVVFTNTSTGYETVSWDFGDGSAASTEVNPEHTYAAAGEFTVKLTATNGGSSDIFTQKITLTDPNALLTSLADDGTGSKTWKLIRDISSGRYPLEVGPANYSTIWWAFGKGNDLALRTCLLNDEWKFSRDGLKMDFDAKGDYWAEGGVFVPAETCASTSSMVGPNGEDLTAWGNGSHTFVLTTTGTQTLQVVGLGAYLGLCKAATGAEVKIPQASVTYEVIKLSEGAVDTLIVQTAYTTGDGQAAYWRFTLVHYDDPSQEPPLPGPKPSAAFDFTSAGMTITCTNTSTDAVSYLWNFGDGTTSTEASPTHTYLGDGIYAIRLTATNPNGTSTTAKDFYYTTTELTALTEAMLIGGGWKVRAEDKVMAVSMMQLLPPVEMALDLVQLTILSHLLLQLVLPGLSLPLPTVQVKLHLLDS
jgi:PKD repeat protein